MKAFPFQHFTLLITLAFVCGAPVKNQDTKAMLSHIRSLASKIPVKLNVTVERIPVPHGPIRCKDEFFCMAQKALEDKSLPVLDELTRQIKAYNNATQRTNCTLPHKAEMKLQCLLKNVVRCVDLTIRK